MGLALFLAFQTGLVLDVQLSRALPPEAKDAYRYIYSAVQLREGFNYNTPALKDLRAQSKTQPGDSMDRQNLKWDNYHSLFFTHYLLHSALLLVISWISGVSLGTAYKITCVLGSLLIAGAISFFLLTITDRTSAGLALGSMALTMFPMQGIHYVVPTNISLAVGLILLAVVLRTGGNSKWLLFWLSLVVIFLHRMGIIYASLGVLATVFLRYKEENIKQIVFDLLPTLLIMCLYVLITYILPLPMFRLSPMAKPLDTSYFKEVWANFEDLLGLFWRWFLMHGVITVPESLQNLIISKFSKSTQDLMRNNWSFLFLSSQILGLCLLILPWLLKKGGEEKLQVFRWIVSLGGALILLPILSAVGLIIIIVAGWLHPPQEKRISFYLSFVMFLFILFPSLLHVMYIAEPGHPIIRADLTNRLWVPCAVVLAAIFGRGLWWVFQEIRRGTYEFLPEKIRHQELSKVVLQPRNLWAIFFLFVVIGYAPHWAQAYEERASIKYFMLIRQNVVFNQDQVRWVMEHSGPQDIMVYDDDFIRHYFLCHGGLWRRALFLPLLPLPQSFHFNPGDIKYEIGWNPYLLIQHYENVRDVEYPLNIPGGSIYKLTLNADFQPDELRLLPGSGTAGQTSTKLRLFRESASGVRSQQDIQILGKDWQTVPLNPERGGSLTLINLEPSVPFLLGGLKFGGQLDQKFVWPWHGVVEVSLDDKRLQIKRADFLTDERKIDGVTYDREVLQDSGSTVLWRLRPKNGNNLGLLSWSGGKG